MLKNHADFFARFPQPLFIKRSQFLTVNDDRAGSGPLQKIDAANEGALASAALADDSKNLSLFNGEADAPQGVNGVGTAGSGISFFNVL